MGQSSINTRTFHWPLPYTYCRTNTSDRFTGGHTILARLDPAGCVKLHRAQGATLLIGRSGFSREKITNSSKVLIGGKSSLKEQPQMIPLGPIADVSLGSKSAQKPKSPAPSIGSRRQRAEKRLRFRDLGKFRGRRKTLERRREQGMSLDGTARGIMALRVVVWVIFGAFRALEACKSGS